MTTSVKTVLNVTSPAFVNEGMIPAIYTCKGENINPPLRIGEIPNETISMVLIVEDPDAPGKIFDHWLVWNIPKIEMIEQNSVPGKVGRNSKGQNKYTGPCPPSGTHRYFFKLFALNTLLQLDESATKIDVFKAMQSHIVAYGEIMGLYKK